MFYYTNIKLFIFYLKLFILIQCQIKKKIFAYSYYIFIYLKIGEHLCSCNLLNPLQIKIKLILKIYFKTTFYIKFFKFR